MTTREDFLARVAAGLGRSARTAPAAAPKAPGVDDGLVRLTGPGVGLRALFSERAIAAGMLVHRCGLDRVGETVRGLLESAAAKCVVVDHLDPTLAELVSGIPRTLGARVINPREVRGLDAQFDADAGITGVVAAIAETGTLVVASDVRRSRGAFIVPPMHIALVRESQIIPDMVDLWVLIGQRPPTAITLVTGPSKTADIEGVLVTGVHGPGTVHIVVVETPAAS